MILLHACDRQQSVLAAAGRHRAYTTHGYSDAPSRAGRLGFNGQLEEALTGHYLLGNGHRAYNPVLMRFNSPDLWSPMRLGGLNAYAYCLGDPVNRLDPSGHLSMVSGLSLLGLAVSVLTLGSATPLALAGLVLGAAGTVQDVRTTQDSQAPSGTGTSAWVLGGLALGAGALGGLFYKFDDIVDLTRKALTRGTSARPPSVARTLIESELAGLSNPSSFSRALVATNRNLASHGVEQLSPGHARRYVELATDANAGHISSTTAHWQAAAEWTKVPGPSGTVGTLFNRAAVLMSGAVDGAERKTGTAIRRASR